MPVERQSTPSRPLRLALLALAWLTFASVAQADTTIIHFPRNTTPDGQRDEYPYRLLALALSRAGAQYTLQQTERTMQQGRALLEIARGEGEVDIVATMTSRDRERLLLPIRIPIDKGLLGWRVAFVKAGNRDLLKDVRDLHDLAQFRAGQGLDWPDLEIMRASGLQVRGVSDYESLFRMLRAERFDYFPRGVIELKREAATRPGLEIDPYLVLRYPTAYYFFVRQGNVHLADAVRRGLEAAIADGSLNQLFMEYYGPTIREANLAQRRIVDIPNPLLPAPTPLNRKELWYTLEK